VYSVFQFGFCRESTFFATISSLQTKDTVFFIVALFLSLGLSEKMDMTFFMKN